MININASKFLSSDIVTEFRGRGDEIRIYPLSFAEFYSVYDGDYDDAWDDYMIYGGLPQIVSFQSERQKADYLKNIFANVPVTYTSILLMRSRLFSTSSNRGMNCTSSKRR